MQGKDIVDWLILCKYGFIAYLGHNWTLPICSTPGLPGGWLSQAAQIYGKVDLKGVAA